MVLFSLLHPMSLGTLEREQEHELELKCKRKRKRKRKRELGCGGTSALSTSEEAESSQPWFFQHVTIGPPCLPKRG